MIQPCLNEPLTLLRRLELSVLAEIAVLERSLDARGQINVQFLHEVENLTLNFFANFFEHGDIDLPLGLEKRLAFLVITPALHRRHHSRETALLNSNYGTIFSFWDRAFGSFGSSRSDVQIQIGLPGVSKALGPQAALMMPVRDIYRGV